MAKGFYATAICAAFIIIGAAIGMKIEEMGSASCTRAFSVGASFGLPS